MAEWARLLREGVPWRQRTPWIPLFQTPPITAWRTDKLGGPIREYTAGPYGGFADVWAWHRR